MSRHRFDIGSIAEQRAASFKAPENVAWAQAMASTTKLTYTPLGSAR